MWHATSITQTAYQNYCFLGPPNQAVRRPKVTLGLKIWRITQAIHGFFFFDKYQAIHVLNMQSITRLYLNT